MIVFFAVAAVPQRFLRLTEWFTARLLESVMREHGVENFGVASNPEFLAQGNAVEGSRRPDRIAVSYTHLEDNAVEI